MNKKRFTLSLAFFFLFLNHSKSQEVNPLLVDLLDHTLDSMHQVVPAKSLSAAIQFSNGAIWISAVGITGESPEITASTDQVYLMGSIVKTITSACVLQMHDEALLNIDDSIYHYLPPIENVDSTITIRQLLQHTSGLYDVLSNASLNNAMLSNVNQIWTAEEVIDQYLLAPLNEPGANWSYCNTNYFLLGMIIEELSGQPFYAELRERFFTPLQLNTFGIPSFEVYNQPVAHVWMDLFGTGATQDAHFFYYTYLSLNSVAGAAGGYYATPTDISRWMRTYMRGDLLEAATLADAMTTMAAPGLPSTTYGLGLNRKMFDSYVGFGHGGDLAYSASSWYFPELDISITVCGNDQDYISWELIPVVRALIRKIDQNIELSAAELQQENAPTITCYPNPTANELTINVDDSVTSLRIMSSVGSLLLEEKKEWKGSKKVDISAYPTGVYFLELDFTNGSRQIVKVSKM